MYQLALARLQGVVALAFWQGVLAQRAGQGMPSHLMLAAPRGCLNTRHSQLIPPTTLPP